MTALERLEQPDGNSSSNVVSGRAICTAAIADTQAITEKQWRRPGGRLRFYAAAVCSLLSISNQADALQGLRPRLEADHRNR